MSDYCIVFNTCPDAATAEALAAHLVDKGLAACVSILPHVKSVYIWQGKRETSAEHLLIIKTRRDAYAALEAAIRNTHPYELPEIIAVPLCEGFPAYLRWMDEAVDKNKHI